MSNAVKIMDYNTLLSKGDDALLRELGPVGMVRYLEQYDKGGNGDYTKEKYENPNLSIDEIVGMRI